ncbi:hypothetical protein, partial [Ruminococcus sp.]|uniref:hypothetical protein n=1 Tax=Ruminococcus sp. TaxID=41978 RepID=UPI0030790F2F
LPERGQNSASLFFRNAAFFRHSAESGVFSGKPLKNAKNALTTGSGCAILKPIRCMTNTTVETVTRIVQF